VLLGGALAMSLAVIWWPDYCADAPDWLRYILGCECSGGDGGCSGAR
jgi:hypothetical protein